MIKNIKIITLVFCMAALLAACGGGGGGGDSTPFTMAGTWGMDTTGGVACHNCIVMQLNANGTGAVADNRNGIAFSITWSYDGSTLRICRVGLGCSSGTVTVNNYNSITLGSNTFSRR